MGSIPLCAKTREGALADKSPQLILDALSRGLAEPAGLPLHGSRTAPGLFPGTAGGKLAARRCLDQKLLRVLHTEPRGKTVVDVCGVTDEGLAHLLSQVSPKRVLEDLVRALEARQGQVSELLATVRHTQSTFDALKATTEKVLLEIHRQGSCPAPQGAPPSAAAWTGAVLDHLAGWQQAKPSEDCPLPELYEHARRNNPTLSIGHFHDGLRLLHDRAQIYLHPWTGPLYQIPEPPYALLIGHEIAYYASRRSA
jgi:hypothetical protein